MPIAVELSQIDAYGMQKTALNAEGLIDKTGKAFDEAMATIHEIAEKVNKMIETAGPDETEVSFSIKLTGEASAVIAKTSIEGTFGVKLVWKKKG